MSLFGRENIRMFRMAGHRNVSSGLIRMKVMNFLLSIERNTYYHDGLDYGPPTVQNR